MNGWDSVIECMVVCVGSTGGSVFSVSLRGFMLTIMKKIFRDINKYAANVYSNLASNILNR